MIVLYLVVKYNMIMVVHNVYLLINFYQMVHADQAQSKDAYNIHQMAIAYNVKNHYIPNIKDIA